jgi:type VI secretion system secreted protein VgrG
MATYSQANRPLKVDTPLGADTLLLSEFEGTEAVSTPYLFTLELLSEEDSVDAMSLLRKPVVITIKLASGGERFIHGVVRQFMQLGRKQGLNGYRMEIVPQLWFLTLGSDCRIFQAMNAVEIVQKVLNENKVTDLDVRCTKSYPPREFCVQYRETHFAFVSRLLEEEGIFYFFEHSQGKHVLVLSDDPTSTKPCPFAEPAKMAQSPEPWQESDVIVDLTMTEAVHTGQVTLRDYDPLQPSLNLESVAGQPPSARYDYPGKFTQVSDGTKYARLEVEEYGSRQQAITGSGNCRYFVTGHQFSVADHFRSDVNAAHHLLEVHHTASAGDYRSWDSAPIDYRNTFVAVPAKTKFRPPRVTPRPIVHGTQTALVVGQAGEEIWVDEHGRVKVQFYWDREGTKNEKSSCWVRVASTWAGKQWGFVQIPRMGQEVVVAFLEGDPDRPIIVGSVYNAEQVPPYALPGNKTQSGVKSRSTLGGSGDNFNEIRFEDKKGSEQIVIHAEKDKIVEVEHDRNESVGNDETYKIGHDQTTTIGNDQSFGVGNNQTVNIGKNRTESVGADEAISISGGRTETVGKDEAISIGQNRSENVGKDENVDIGQNRTVTIAKNETVNIGETRSVEIGKDDTLTVAKRLVLDAGEAIEIKTGDASISMSKDGSITIKGKDIAVSGSGSISVKASSEVTVKGSKVLSN